MLTIVFLIVVGMFAIAGTFISIEVKRRNQRTASAVSSRKESSNRAATD